MRTGELRFLTVARRQFVANVVEKLDIALLRVLLEGSDEGPGHGTSSLGCNRGVGSKKVLLST